MGKQRPRPESTAAELYDCFDPQEINGHMRRVETVVGAYGHDIRRSLTKIHNPRGYEYLDAGSLKDFFDALKDDSAQARTILQQALSTCEGVRLTLDSTQVFDQELAKRSWGIKCPKPDCGSVAAFSWYQRSKKSGTAQARHTATLENGRIMTVRHGGWTTIRPNIVVVDGRTDKRKNGSKTERHLDEISGHFVRKFSTLAE